MVPGMWSNVKNSATPGNNKSPGVASPQNKYTPLCKSSIWTMSRRKDAPDTSPAHPLTHTTAPAHASSTGPTQLYLFTRLFICLFVELNEKCLWGIGKYYLVIYYYTGPLRSNTHTHAHTTWKFWLFHNGRFGKGGGGGGKVQGLWIWRFD